MDYITSNWQIAVRKYQVVMHALKADWPTIIRALSVDHMRLSQFS